MRPGRVGAAVAVAALALPGAGCTDDVSDAGEGDGARIAPYAAGIRIGWDYRTRQRLMDAPASYPRMTRLENGGLLVSVESAGASYVLISEDDGATWSDPILAATAPDEVIAAVPSVLQLASGRVLLAYNTRPPQDNADPSRRFGIKLAASSDGGRSWEPWADVYDGGHTWGTGVWEPAMIQLGTGEILLYFANESPYTESNDQEISLVRSADEGRTWSSPERVSYRQGHRDGMPVPLLLRSGETIAVAIEDDGLVAGPFKPVIVRLPGDGSLDSGHVDGDSPQRTPALAESSRLPVPAYGGAPYLVQLPAGETVLSFQSNEGRTGDWASSTMVVAIGDERAAGFTHKSYPFPVPEGRRALWNALFVKDASTVAALSSTTAFDPTRQELYIIDGHRIPEPAVRRGSIVVDGDGADADWATATTVFVGAYSPKVAELRTAWDAEMLYLRFDVLEGGVVDGEALSAQDDAVTVALATTLVVGDVPGAGAYMLRVEAGGAHQLFRGADGAWAPVASSGVVVAGSQPEPAAPDFDGVGYRVEIGIPWDEVGGRPAAGAPWGLTGGIVNRDARGVVTREWVAGTLPDRPSTWLKATLDDS